MKKNNLLVINPELAKEWHPAKNGKLTPEMVTYGSNKKVWWLCSYGHEWQAVICSRNIGRGCPICSNNTIHKGFNDLTTKNPKLAKEWHPTKNHKLTSEMVTAGSKVKVWWQGECGHEWQAAINSRNQGSRCPICSNQQVLKRYNDLATTNPKLAKEWHPTKNGKLTPEIITAGSGKKVWWQGKCGHEWQAVINSRNQGMGCPVCARELRSSFPEQAVFYYLKKIFVTTVNSYKIGKNSEIDIYIKELKLGIEYDGAAWHKNLEKDIRKNILCKNSNIELIRIREKGCPVLDDGTYCIILEDNSLVTLEKAIKKIFAFITEKITHSIYSLKIDISNEMQYINELLINKNKLDSLFAKNKQLAKEWHPSKNGKVTPEMVTTGSDKKVWWQCSYKHEWQATVGSRNQGNGCPICSGKQVFKGYNDLAKGNPKLAKEWHPTKNKKLSPEMVTAYSNKKVWWQCSKRHEWQAVISHRNNGTGCPICSNKQVLKGYNDLAITNPELAKEWHPSKNGKLTSNMVMSNTNKKVWWQCSKRHEWQAGISDRNNGNGCPICSNQQVLKGYNDLATTNPKLAKEWHPTKNGKLTPKIFTAGSGKKVWWKCAYGHEWETRIADRNKGKGCPICCNQQILKGHNDLATKSPNLAKEWHPVKNGNLTSKMITVNSGRKVWWQCSKGHEWQVSVDSRSRGNGCPFCSGRQAIKGHNDLATVNPELAKEWHPTKNGNLTPEMIKPFSNKNVWWQCEHGHEWQALVSRRNNGKTCPVCTIV